MAARLPNLTSGSTEWLDNAACADLDVADFFVQAGHVIRDEVLEVCRTCPVRLDCIRHAYSADPPVTGGYFGGMSPGDRKKMTLKQAIADCERDSAAAVAAAASSVVYS